MRAHEAQSSGGSLAAAQLYAPYGGVRYTTGSMPTARAFTGQYADAVSGLDYYHARYYDPVAGQFISADAVKGGQGPNRYAYVAGNPTTRTDPTGQRCDADGCGGGSGGTPPPSNGGVDNENALRKAALHQLGQFASSFLTVVGDLVATEQTATLWWAANVVVRKVVQVVGYFRRIGHGSNPDGLVWVKPYVRSRPGALAEAEALEGWGRTLKWVGFGLVAAGGIADGILYGAGYYEGDTTDPQPARWAKAVTAGFVHAVISTGASVLGALGGGAAGAWAGAAIPVADATGIPEAVLGLIGTIGGGIAGAQVGTQIADDWTPTTMNALFSPPTQVPDYSLTPMGCL